MSDNNEIVAVISALGGIVALIGGYLVKAHINKSACCGGYGCECVCDGDELEAVNTVKRIKTERKRRESQQIVNNIDIEKIIDSRNNSTTDSIKSANSDVFINIDNQSVV